MKLSKRNSTRRASMEKADEALQNVLATLSGETQVSEKKLISTRQASLTLGPQGLRQVANRIKEGLDGAMGETVVGVDLLNNRFELIYYFWSPIRKVMIEARTQLQGETPSIDSIADIFPGLDWHEREVHEMFGIRFDGHPNLSLLILPDELEGQYPLRKSFQVSRERLKESGIVGPPPKPSKTIAPATSDQAEKAPEGQ